MSPQSIRLDIKTPIPPGYVLGRVSPGVGQAELIDISTLATHVAQTGQLATSGAVSTLASISNNRVLGNTSGASAAPTAQALTAPAAGMTITGGTNAFTFAFANDLGAIEALTGTGIAKRTGADTWALQSSVSVADGKVILVGASSSGSVRDKAEKVAQGIAGVSEIDNRIISVPSR